MNTKEHEPIPFIRELCKHKSEVEIVEAEDNFREFISVIKDICDRLEQKESDGKREIDDMPDNEIMEEDRLSET